VDYLTQEENRTPQSGIHLYTGVATQFSDSDQKIVKG
jgi:hypothetical protein